MTFPVLYILVRGDLVSMNDGKAMAQTSHASNQFIEEHYISHLENGSVIDPNVLAWRKTAKGFGTVLTLLVPAYALFEKTFCSAALLADKTAGIHANIVVDTSYPYILDREYANLIDASFHTLDPIDIGHGKLLLHRQETTCGYIFGMKDNPTLESLTKGYALVDSLEAHYKTI